MRRKPARFPIFRLGRVGNGIALIGRRGGQIPVRRSEPIFPSSRLPSFLPSCVRLALSLSLSPCPKPKHNLTNDGFCARRWERCARVLSLDPLPRSLARSLFLRLSLNFNPRARARFRVCITLDGLTVVAAPPKETSLCTRQEGENWRGGDGRERRRRREPRSRAQIDARRHCRRRRPPLRPLRQCSL